MINLTFLRRENRDLSLTKLAQDLFDVRTFFVPQQIEDRRTKSLKSRLSPYGIKIPTTTLKFVGKIEIWRQKTLPAEQADDMMPVSKIKQSNSQFKTSKL